TRPRGLQDFLDNFSRALVKFRKVWAIAHQAARLNKTTVREDRCKVVSFGECDERTNAVGDHQPLKDFDALDSGVGHRCESGRKLVRITHLEDTGNNTQPASSSQHRGYGCCSG